MREEFEEKLLNFKNITISLEQLDMIMPSNYSYDEFAQIINELEHDDILKMVKASGRNSSTPSIAFRYKINKSQLKKPFYEKLQRYRLTFHNLINLDAYFSLSQTTWQKDLPYLKLIDTFLKTTGQPQTKVPAPERSFQLVGDEKWIESGGHDVLKRTKLLELMKIYPVSDPLMFAINPKTIKNENHFHLIVENKTTYEGLLPILTDTHFSTLTYGSGNKIVKSIENFSYQYPISGIHSFFYFGDIDRSGISIWYSLQKVEHIIPAIPFYNACFQYEKVFGKTNQRLNKKAIDKFVTFFDDMMKSNIHSLVKEGAYYPQEVLSTAQLQQIWLQADWFQIKHNAKLNQK